MGLCENFTDLSSKFNSADEKNVYIYVYIKQSRRKELTTIKRFGLSIEGVTLILTVKNHQLGLRKQRRPGF